MTRTIHCSRWSFSVVPTLMSMLLAMPVAADESIDFKKMAPLSVRVKDEQGNPVEGARVMPYAMRMKEQEGHGYWIREQFGPPKTVVSNQMGVAVIQYPIRVLVGTQALTTRLVTFQVTHTDFVKQDVHFELELGEPQITLKAGCDVQIFAVDGNGTAIDDFGVLMAGPFEPDGWAKVDKGGRRTRSINDGTWQTMLVKIPNEGPILFSSVMPLRVQPQQTVRLRNVRLTPGARLRGRLTDNVPRPVHGYVIATSIPKPAENSWSDKDPSLSWHDWVDVAPDGTFEFASLPRGGQVQLIGICEGWISSTNVPDSPPVFVMGQLFDVEQEQVEVELQMEPTGTLEVKLTTEDGKPFTEGRVVTSPNQKYYKGGSTLLGRRFRSADFIRTQLLPEEQRSDADEQLNFPYIQPVGNDGVAKLTGLPLKRGLSFGLMHDKFNIATDNEAEGRVQVRYELPSPQPVQVEAKVISGQK